jgi:hypothetical protein
MRRLGLNVILVVFVLFGAAPCWAWGDEGHMIVAAVAERFLEPGARDRVNALLSADDDTLTAGMSPAARPGLTNIGIRIGTPRSSAMRPLNNGTSSTPNSTIRTRIRLASKRIRNSDC